MAPFKHLSGGIEENHEFKLEYSASMLRIDAGYSWTIDPALFREMGAKICQEIAFIFARTIFLVAHSRFLS
jgi:hypothetical protein